MIGLVVVALAEPAAAQHTLQRTLTVDQSGSADFISIQAAINSPRIAPNSGVKWTVLIYAGTYPESVTLGGTKENIDLVGIDRDAVIIAPTGASNGITITSGTELSRNNTIRNLTIRTVDGHGIEIAQGIEGTTPKDIVIEDCVIEADGTGKDGIQGAGAEDVVVLGCDIESQGSNGVDAGNRWTISNSTCRTTGGNLAGNRDAVRVALADDVFILDSTLDSVLRCVLASGKRLLIKNCILRSTGAGGPVKGAVVFNGATDPKIIDCFITNDATAVSQTAGPRGIFLDHPDGVKGAGLVSNCVIRVIGGNNSQSAIGIQIDKLIGALIVTNCTIEVDNSASTNLIQAHAVGIEYKCTAGCGEGCFVFGGTISAAGREREATVYDIRRDIGDFERLFISGSHVSKWHGPIKSSERRRSTVQRVVGVSPGTNTAVLSATPLLATEQIVTTGITQPDVYRVVTVQGSSSVGTDKIVYVIGTNFAGDAITDIIVLNNDTIVAGDKPFAAITKIILPGAGPGQTVSIGTSDKLGLQFPIGDTTDVIEIGRKASVASSYAIESLMNFTIDEVYATVAPSTITSGDSFEFVVLSSQ